VSGAASPVAQALQNALATLGRTVRDGVLMAVVADGTIGPATASAVNRAFTTHIGAGQAPAQFRTGRLSIFEVAQYAADLTKLISAEVARRGGTPAAAAATFPSTADPNSSAAMVPGPATMPLPERSSSALWALGGLALLAVGAGIYFMASSDSASSAG
jgi:aryl-alcohol dehydrogenase-like predicted oxidoreductase